MQGPTHTRGMVQPAEGETRKSRKARTVPYQARYNGFLAKLISAREEAGINPERRSRAAWHVSFVDIED